MARSLTGAQGGRQASVMGTGQPPLWQRRPAVERPKSANGSRLSQPWMKSPARNPLSFARVETWKTIETRFAGIGKCKSQRTQGTQTKTHAESAEIFPDRIRRMDGIWGQNRLFSLISHSVCLALGRSPLPRQLVPLARVPSRPHCPQSPPRPRRQHPQSNPPLPARAPPHPVGTSVCKKKTGRASARPVAGIPPCPYCWPKCRSAAG